MGLWQDEATEVTKKGPSRALGSCWQGSARQSGEAALGGGQGVFDLLVTVGQ